jgi:hypothetical protein
MQEAESKIAAAGAAAAAETRAEAEAGFAVRGVFEPDPFIKTANL